MKFGEHWAEVIRSVASVEETRAVLRGIEGADTNRAAIIVACAFTLATFIAETDPDLAKEVRAGIRQMIDGFAMQGATER